MTIAIAGSTDGGAVNGGTVTLTYPAGTNSSGNCAIVNVTLGTSRALALAVASSSGAAFTQIVATVQSSNVRFGVFRRIIGSTGETLCTVTGTAGSTDSTTSIIHIFSGVDQTTPEDAAATSTSGGSSTPDSPSITVASCGCAIITSVGVGNSLLTLTAPSSFIDVTTNKSTDTRPSGNGQAWILYNSTAAINPASWTSSLSATWISATIALRPSVSTEATWSDTSVISADSLIRESRTITVRSY